MIRKIVMGILLTLCITGCDLNKVESAISSTIISLSTDDPKLVNFIPNWVCLLEQKQELLKEYEKTNTIFYKTFEERYKNPYFFPIEREKQELFVYFDEEYREVHINIDYLFSFETGDIYLLSHSPIQYDLNEPIENEDYGELIGYFYVNDDMIIRITDFGEDVSTIFEISEEKILDINNNLPVCFTKCTLEVIEEYDELLLDAENRMEFIVSEQVRLDISINGNFIMVRVLSKNSNNDNFYYQKYVWKKEEGLVGYQYGRNAGGEQHDFYKTKEVLFDFLDNGVKEYVLD